ncbi:MAG: SagB/ThcOx family dehydrogenase [Oscillospiraceae bacterium]|nr:SagB/ThcOx family dehydrogenase [Oscillospiraceae bacterium]
MNKGSDEFAGNRAFMKCSGMITEELGSGEQKGLTPPPPGKAPSGKILELPAFAGAVKNKDFSELLEIRRSVRAYSGAPAAAEQLAFMLWSVQGVLKYKKSAKTFALFKPAPSGGARHPFEIYAVVLNVEGLEPGIYHYLPMEHVGEKRSAVEFVSAFEKPIETISEMLMGQSWASKASFVLFFSCIPYRAEWRYGHMSHRAMLIDIGHAGQNAMLSAAALGLGSCCCARYNSALCDKVLGIDGKDEFTVYAVPVGVPKIVRRFDLT